MRHAHLLALLHTFMEELTNQDAIDFIHYHIEMTTPVFGEWNYSKHLKQHLLTRQSGCEAAVPLKKRWVGVRGLDGDL
jgi:hypothetical protein